MDSNIAREALSMALHEGVQAARVTLVRGCGTTVSLRDGEIDTLQGAASSALHLNIFADGRYGVFTTNRTGADQVRTFIHNAVDATRLLVPDRYRALPERGLCYDGRGGDLGIEDRDYPSITQERKLELLREVASSVPSHPKLLSTECEYEDERTEEVVADTEGLDVSESRTFFSICTECTLRDTGDIRPQNWWVDGSITFSGVDRGGAVRAFRRTSDMLGAVRIPSGRYRAVFENGCSRSLVSTLVDALSGSALDQRNSFLCDSLGKQILPDGMSLCDRPHIPGMTGSSWYDAEGIATADTDIIRDGVICTYYLGTYYARKMGMPATVQAPSACRFLNDSGLGCDGLMREMGRGILVTGFNGGSCNPLTGDFSYGVEGFLFENGERVHPIKEMNISGDMLTLWKTLSYIGNDPRSHTGWQIPSLAFGECDFSGL